MVGIRVYHKNGYQTFTNNTSIDQSQVIISIFCGKINQSATNEENSHFLGRSTFTKSDYIICFVKFPIQEGKS